ncbi:hypothetical protein KUCAC02_002567 [Chaenocephalus aceratus]|uniref:Uncharacterized protein n=1 Tax=Chaenocephalus aceratus TaxID=36190 RepID=A0ACB9XTY7_CHAAC|nr:hypothetical protein KUCAC02_002567 [Chaenocephalus aceratus]
MRARSGPSPPLSLLPVLYTSPVYQIRQRLWKGHSSLVGPLPLPSLGSGYAFGLRVPRASLLPSRLPEAPKPSLVSQHAGSIMSDISISPVITRSAWDHVLRYD